MAYKITKAEKDAYNAFESDVGDAMKELMKLPTVSTPAKFAMIKLMGEKMVDFADLKPIKKTKKEKQNG